MHSFEGLPTFASKAQQRAPQSRKRAVLSAYCFRCRYAGLRLARQCTVELEHQCGPELSCFTLLVLAKMAAWSYIKPPRSKEGACETAHLYIAGVGRALGTCENDVMQELCRYGIVQHLLMEADKVTTTAI
jgi:hypothetical protein